MARYTVEPHSFVAFKVPAEHADEADRFFEHHAEWMERTHPRDGEEALLQYTVSKNSDGEGNILILLAEVYKTKVGIDNHRKPHHGEPGLHEELVGLVEKCEATIGRNDSEVVHSLW